MKNVRVLFANFTAKVKKHRKLSVVPVIVLLLFVYFGLRQLTRTDMPTYQTAKVERGVIVSSITASGQIVSTNGVTVTTQASGVIKEVFVTDGTAVNSGDKIMEMTLDPQGQQKASQAWSSYLSTQNTLLAAQSKQHSLQSAMFKANQAFVNDKGVFNPSDTQKADPKYIEENADWLASEADYKNQSAVIVQAQAAVTSSWQAYQAVSPLITAPIAGTVSDFIYAKGMSIVAPTTAQKVATIRNSGQPVAQYNLSELDVAKVKSGQKANVTVDAVPSKSFRGVVIGVDTSGVITTGVTNYPVTVEFDAGVNQIFSNMAANVSIVIDEKKQALIVPSVAIQDQDGKTFVRVRRNGKIQQIPVVIGLTSDTETEIIEGISDGEEVVTAVMMGTGSQSAQIRQSPFSTGGLRPGGFGGQRR